MCTCGHRHPQAGCWLCDCRRHEATPPAPPVPVGPLPCPFCGSAAKLYPSNPALTGDAWTAVECANPECPVDVGVAIHQDSGHREAAIGLWNTRHAALRSPSPEPPAPDVLCPYGDPLCPCQDGDPCHYEGDNPMTPPCPKCRGTGHSEYTGYPDCDVVDCGACMGTGTASPSPEPPAPPVPVGEAASIFGQIEQTRFKTVPRTPVDDARLRELAEGFRAESPKPEASSAEWWREVAQGLAAEVAMLRADAAAPPVRDARWAEFLENWVDYHHGDGNSDRAWEEFQSGEPAWRRIR
jgi:hypothetical protein